MTDTTNALSTALAIRVQDHLGEEEQCLSIVLHAVRQLHASLRGLDGDAMAVALQNESEALRQAQAMQDRRQHFRETAARELGVTPEEFTLSLVARRSAGEFQDGILRQRARLAEMSAEMDRLNRQNAAMICQSLMLMRGIEGRLTGTAPAADSYNAGGAREEAHVGPLIQWGG